MELVEANHKICKVWVVTSQAIYSELLFSYLSTLTAKTHDLIVSKSEDFCLFINLWIWWALGSYFDSRSNTESLKFAGSAIESVGTQL